MTLLDPTGGAGYMFGAVLPSTHQTLVGANQPKSLDGAGGGAYTLAANIDLTGPFCIRLMGTQRLLIASRHIIRCHSLIPAQKPATNWTINSRGTHSNTPAASSITLELSKLADGQVLNSVTVRYKGGAGHAAFPGGKPGTMPTVTVYKIDKDDSDTNLGSQVDTSATAAAFESSHDITVAAIAHTIDLTQYRYTVLVETESGANYLAGDVVSGLLTDTTVTSYSEI